MKRYAVQLSVVALLGVACTKAGDSTAKAGDTGKVQAAATTPDTVKPAGTSPTDSAAATAGAMAAPPNSAAKGPPPSGPSTQVGVYTNEQASRGKNVYAGSCRSCHSPTSHTGDVFAGWWQNKRLSELYTFILTQMPKNDPGTLAPEDVADVVAYLLKMNEMPTGKEELYPDADSLKKFWVDTRKAK